MLQEYRRMKKVITIGVSLLFGITFSTIVAKSAVAATYYVAPNGNDSSAGTQSSPWLTPAHAGAVAVAGDTVYFRAGTYNPVSGNNFVLQVAHDGTASSPIIFRAFTGETPIFQSAIHIIDLSNRNYVQVDGITAQNVLAGGDDGGWLLLRNATHNTISNMNCTFTGQSTGVAWIGIDFDNASYNKLLNSRVDKWGIHASPYINGGDAVQLNNGSHHNLVQGNYLGAGGHASLQIDGGYLNIIRNNTFDNPLEKGFEATQRRTGRFEYNFLEGNTFLQAGYNTEGHGGMHMHVNSNYNIIRNNILRDAQGWGIDMQLWGTETLTNVGNHFFNNTVVHNGIDQSVFQVYDATGIDMTDFGYTGAPYGNHVIKNNIFYDNQPLTSFSPARNTQLYLGLSSSRPGGPWWGAIIAGNDFYYSSTSQAVITNVGLPDGTVSYYQTNYPANFFGNIQSAPQFVSYSTGVLTDPHDGSYNLNLQSGSPGISNGVDLAHTTAAGSGTVVHVDDSLYFQDGFGGMITADAIQIGTQLVNVVSMDYPNNNITIDRSISWAANAAVNLPLAGTRPTIGIYQSGSSTASPSPVGSVTPNPTASPGVSPTPTPPPNYDLNSDGRVTTADITMLLGRMDRQPITIGDFNGDGVVNSFDFARLLTQLPVPSPSPTGQPSSSPGNGTSMRGAGMSLSVFYSNSPNYQPNAWSIIQSLGINTIRVYGGVDGDVAGINMTNNPNTWAQTLDAFLTQASQHNVKVVFHSMGECYGLLFGIVSPGMGCTATSQAQALTMVDQLGGNNSLNHNFLSDPRVAGWRPSNEVDINDPTTLNWNLAIADRIRSHSGQVWLASPRVAQWFSGEATSVTEPLLRGHVDFIERHEYALDGYQSCNRQYQCFHDLFLSYLQQYLIAGHNNIPIDHLILGEYGIWNGTGTGGESNGQTLTFSNAERRNYYQAVLDAARDAGIKNVMLHDLFAQLDGGAALSPMWSVIQHNGTSFDSQLNTVILNGYAAIAAQQPGVSPTPVGSPRASSSPSPVASANTSPTPAPSGTSFGVPFNSNSIWNQAITNSPTLDPNSAQQISTWAGLGQFTTIAGTPGDGWGVEVVYADANTPRRRVCGVDDSGNGSYYCESSVPIPDNIQTPPDSDGKLTIIDTSTTPNHAWNFYQLRHSTRGTEDYTGGGFGAYGWVNPTSTGDGLRSYQGGQWGGRAAGSPYYGGLINPEEITQGHIDHALAISLNCSAVSSNRIIWPARGSDGCGGTGTNVLGYGARVQLDPALDINSLGLSAGGRVIARALQTYGAWVLETGGTNFALYAREFVTSTGAQNNAPWNGLLSSGDIQNIPINRFRVLAPAVQSNFFVEP